MNDIAFVYVIKSNNTYKIGISGDVNKRMRAIYRTTGLKVDLISSYQVRDARSLEWLLHQKFSHKNIHGEWFNLDESDLVAIDETCKTEVVGFTPDLTRKPRVVKAQRQDAYWFAIEYPMSDGAGQYYWCGIVGANDNLIQFPEPYRVDVERKLNALGLKIASHK